MNNEKKSSSEGKKTYFGLDLGTENIGFAVTDDEYNIAKVNGKNALGILTYSSKQIEAQSASARRAFRTTRKRLQRRKFRISLLQELFCGAMMKKDKNFFVKLNENDLQAADKTVNEGKYSLFNDKGYTDVDYYKEYPTIYHLREELSRKATTDIRKLYLAVHNIIKYRGHFLINGGLSECFDIAPVFAMLNDELDERNIDTEEMKDYKKIDMLSNFEKDKFDKIIIDANMRKKDKKIQTCLLLKAETAQQKKLVEIMYGGVINVSALFGEGAYPNKSIENFYFDEKYEQIEPQLVLELEERDYRIICQLKKIRDYITLTTILKGKESISSAMIEKFNKHKRDLKQLKELAASYEGNYYEEMFGLPLGNKDEEMSDSPLGKEDEEMSDSPRDKENKVVRNNYVAYVGGGRSKDGKKAFNNRLGKTCSRKEFYTFLNKYLDKLTEKDKTENAEIIASIKADIEDDVYMPKVISKDNSIIPHQLNALELEKILKTAADSGYYDWLKKTDDGMTVSDKIKSLLEFRVPYYAGPVKFYRKGEQRSKNSWIVRKEGRITPWTFDKLVDKNACNEEFIKRMTNSCTYLKNENALPKNSIVFKKFLALSELNKLKVNGELMSVELKREIYDKIYLKNGKPTIAKIKKLLKSKGVEVISVSGFDEELKESLNSYHIIRNIIGDKIDKFPLMAERLVFLMTIHNDSGMLETSIKKEFGDKLSKDEIKLLKGVTFSGWGRFSLKLLAGNLFDDGILLTDSTGEMRDIITILEETNLGLMEIVHSKNFNFAEVLKEYYDDAGYNDDERDVTYEDVEEMYCSPAVKRSVWQAFGLVKELVKNTKTIPDKIFIEVTRKKEPNKGKVPSRKKKIEDLYKKLKEDKNDMYLSELQELGTKLKNIDNGILNSEKIFLYFMQLGRCAYSCKPIDLGENFSNLSNYDVDHIIPRAKKKDDSLDNKVLVTSTLNKDKKDVYPVPAEYRQNADALWKTLLKAGLMTKEKYERLARKTPLTRLEEESFINRQLVETSQTALLLRDLLEKWFAYKIKQEASVGDGDKNKKADIIFVKASNVSDFRKKFSLSKSREVNDFHHAADAYLNIVVGNVLNEKYNHGIDYVSEDKESANFVKTFENNVKSYKEKRYVWVNDKNYCTICKIQKQLDTNDYAVSRKTVTAKGELYNSTIYKAEKWSNKKGAERYPMQESKLDEKGNELHPRSDTYRYGNYKSSGTAYFVIIDSLDKAGQKQRSIEAMPIFYDKKVQNGQMTILEVFEKLGLIKPEFAKIKGLPKPILKMGSLIEMDGARLRIAGMTGNEITLHNANQLYVTNEINNYVKELSIMHEKAVKTAAHIPQDELKGKTAEKKSEPKINTQDLAFRALEEEKRRRKEVNEKTKIIFITKENNLKVYEFLAKKAASHPFIGVPRYDPFRDALALGKQSFVDMDEYRQLRVILKILPAFQCNALKVDMSDLNWVEEKNGIMKTVSGKKTTCNIRINKKITDKRITLIYQNKTGLKEQRFLLT